MSNNKKTAIYGVIGIILFGFMAVMLFTTRKDVLFDNPTDFYDAYYDGDLKKDMYVELYVDGVVGNYAETEHRTNCIPTGTDQHYLIWLDDDSFISLTVKDKDLMGQLDKITDNTWDYVDGKTDVLDKSTTVKGVVSTMDSEIEGFCNQWLDELGISHSDMTYLTIDTTETKGSTILYLVFALAMIAVSVFLLVTSIKKDKVVVYTTPVVNPDQTSNGSGIDENTFR